MELFNLLRQEHQEMNDLLNILVSEPDRDGDALKGLQERFVEVYMVHTLVEEQFLYPAFSDLSEVAQDLAERYINDHEWVQVTIKLMCRQPVGSPYWKKLCWQLLEEVRTHCRREEDELFIILQRGMSADGLARLDERVVDYRHSIIGTAFYGF